MEKKKTKGIELSENIIKKIVQYQKKNEITTFSGAVRLLVMKSLEREDKKNES